MTDSSEDAPKLGPRPSQHIPKPQGTPLPKKILQRIFGTSQAFRSFDEIRPTVTGLTVPLKVREYYYRGYECLEQEDWELAVLFFSRALHLDSQLVDFYALRAEAYIQLCDFSSAIQNLRRAYAFQPENTTFLKRLTLVLYLQGQCLFEQHAYLDALNVFSQAFELQPDKPCFRYRCMACLLALQRHHDCLLLVTKEVKHGTTNADIHIFRARLYNFLQKPNLCYQDLHSALLLDPKHPQARSLLKIMVSQAQKSYQDARILAVQGKLLHALQCVNCAIENNPLDPRLFLFRGTMYRRLREFDAAVEDFLKALDMMTEHQEDMMRQAQRQLLLTYNDFAVHCYTHGAYQESVLLLNKALKDEQQEKGLYINRGDCFFQLGHLTFAEADYLEALALSPHDEGANLRMGLLQERMGYREHRSKQFSKAESHFSMAIQHTPERAQCYVHRAKSRQLMQNIFGARQDIATALLLDPKQPKLLPLMTNLFPDMSVEEVLGSQVAHLARLQLSQVMKSKLQKSMSQGIIGQLWKQELERQKAQGLQLSWEEEPPLCETSEKPDSTPQTLEAEPKPPQEATGAKEEEKPEPALSKVRSLSASYFEQTSSGSVLGFRTLSTSETETSITWQYRSNSTTTGTFSDSSLLKTLSSDLGTNREDLSLSHRPRETQVSWGQNQKSSKTETMQSESQSQMPSNTKATRGPRQKPDKTKTTQVSKQRLRKTKAARRRSRGPSKAKATRGRSCGLTRSSSKTMTVYDPSWSPGDTEATQGQGQRPSNTEVPQSWSQSTSPEFSNIDVTQDLSQTSSQTQAAQAPSPGSYTVP
ncbi:tetratricopeptide repeat protein 16 [Molossus molossus]|uniref:Tetratricopeptide repeat domain 16 n=1 Tax=Molossus molossus TaxID=27622 RepID=A0A7J8EH60_MOLMO|nr:tetratricopeptide repeat protein 16 [Molossus molossus]KAF6434740.1 tetratricopeptide repeat domain 16 [Molossus molossus]